MPDFVNVEYAQTGGSISVNPLGMREMQERAYEARFSEYLLLKAPPASGKSRALMFLRTRQAQAPEDSEGHRGGAGAEHRKFLCAHGVDGARFLCRLGPQGRVQPLYALVRMAVTSKVQKFHAFMEGDAQILICTHATLRFRGGRAVRKGV